ncbi:MAG: GNAT family N-acetyltransferase [bacterium]|nr:GNAT family N-acetyltransferase [bacterium]
MIEVFEATRFEIGPLVDLEARLFLEDAGQHDPFADPTWPQREGRKDFEDLIASPEAVVLAARESAEIIGLLAGYATKASPTRQPVEYAVLRTMYVAESARRNGAAAMLTESFLDWARKRGCVEAHVDHYVANVGAAALYERCGFQTRSVSRVIGL